MTLFEKYGGFATVSDIVHSFYSDVLESPKVKHFFVKIDMATLIDHQTKFISHALGGPAQYDLSALKEGHQHLNITKEEFDEVADILRANLEDAGMEDEDVNIVMAIVESVRDVIVKKNIQ